MLPKNYMKVTRELTGYWGTYLPTVHLEPGMLGEVADGVFSSRGNVSKFAAYRAGTFPVIEQRTDGAVTHWTTKSVSMEVFGASASAPADIAKGGVRLRFGAANEAAIICNGMRSASYDDIGAIKDLLRQLREDGEWDDDICLITDVVVVDSAWLCFSTDAGQAADITASSPLALPAAAVEALPLLGGKADISAAVTATKSSAICTNLPAGGTPLFRAIRFNPTWLGLGQPTLGLVRGEVGEFQEPAFG